MKGSTKLSHGNKNLKGVNHSAGKKRYGVYEPSDLRPHKDGDPGNSRRRHSSKGKSGY